MSYIQIQKRLFSIKLPNLNESSCSVRFPPNLNHLKLATNIKHLHFKGLTNYEDASNLQNFIIEKHLNYKIINKNSRLINNIYPTILTFEFNSIYTGGKRENQFSKATNIPIDQNGNVLGTSNVKYIKTDRGGQVTYHGPGQLVGYFIWDLKLWERLTSRCFVNFIEQCSLLTIKEMKVPNVSTTNNTGVWIVDNSSERKISSIGLNLKRNVTSHGLSININPELRYLNNPNLIMCGLEGYKQTSVYNELGNNVSINIEEAANLLSKVVETRMNNYMINNNNNSEEPNYNLKVEKKTFDSIPNDLNTIYKELLLI